MGSTIRYRWRNYACQISLLMLGLAIHSVVEGSPTKLANSTQDSPLNTTETEDTAVNKTLVTATTQLIEQGDTVMEFLEQYKKTILYLGLTGSGKTTMVQLISGDNSKMESFETEEGTGDFLIKDKNKRISEKNIVSKTIFPELVIDNQTNEAIYDCPGFADTRSVPIEIANTYFIKRIVEHSTHIKIVLVATYNTVKTGQSRNSFLLLLDNYLQFVKEPESFNRSISLLVTKVTTNQKEHQVVKTVAKFLRSFLDEIQDVEFPHSKAKVQAVIEILLLQPENGTYPNIAVFMQPDEAGVLSELDSVQDNRGRIRQMIFNNPYFTYGSVNDSTFGFSLTSNAQLVINSVLYELENNSTGTLKEATEILKQRLVTAPPKPLNATLLQFSRLTNVFSNRSHQCTPTELMSVYSKTLIEIGVSPPLELFTRVENTFRFVEFLEETRKQYGYSGNVTVKLSTMLSNALVTPTEAFGLTHLQRFLRILPKELFSSYDLMLFNQKSYEDMKTAVSTILQSLTRLGDSVRDRTLSQTIHSLKEELSTTNLTDGWPVLDYANSFDEFHENVVKKMIVDLRGRNDAQKGLVRSIDAFKSELSTYERLFDKLDRVIADRTTSGWSYDPVKAVEQIQVSSIHVKNKLQVDLIPLKSQPSTEKQVTQSGKESILFVQGHVIMASELTKILRNTTNFSYLVLEATMTVIIDVDLKLPEKQLYIFAPELLVVGSRRISLDGLHGKKYAYSASPGQEGAVGKPGGRGGTFVCSVGDLRVTGLLTISANGGNGGEGQKGGSGNYNTSPLDGRAVDSSEIAMTGLESLQVPFTMNRDGCCQTGCSVCTTYLVLGEPGKQGRNGLRGGRGGQAGSPGRISLFSQRGTNLNKINKYATAGQPGTGGPGGDAGIGGRNGGGLRVERIHDSFRTETKTSGGEDGVITALRYIPVVNLFVGIADAISPPEPVKVETKQIPVPGSIQISQQTIPFVNFFVGIADAISQQTTPSNLRGASGQPGPTGNGGPSATGLPSAPTLSKNPIAANIHYKKFLKVSEANVFLHQRILQYLAADTGISSAYKA